MDDDGGRSITLEDVEAAIYDLRSRIPEKTEIRAIERLLFIRGLMMGYGIEEACRLMDISETTGYSWRRAWEESGMESVFPHYGGGRRRLLSPVQLESVGEEVAARRMTTAEAREYIRRTYGVDYSAKQVGVRLRELGLRHVRPYELEFESEAEAEAVLNGSSEMRWTRRCLKYVWMRFRCLKLVWLRLPFKTLSQGFLITDHAAGRRRHIHTHRFPYDTRASSRIGGTASLGLDFVAGWSGMQHLLISKSEKIAQFPFPGERRGAHERHTVDDGHPVHRGMRPPGCEE